MGNTKQKILHISLNLFSQSGFSAVSIRDICKQVQVKESSIYYHFKNKQAIFDELLRQFEETATHMMFQLEQALTNNSGTLNGNFYETICDYFFEKYFMDEFCNKIIRLLLIEQFSNDEARKIYDQWMFDNPLHFQSKMFSMLVDMGFIKRANSNYLAIKYYAPIYFFAQRWLFCGVLSEDSKNNFRTDAYGHIQNFFVEIGVE